MDWFDKDKVEQVKKQIKDGTYDSSATNKTIKGVIDTLKDSNYDQNRNSKKEHTQ